MSWICCPNVVNKRFILLPNSVKSFFYEGCTIHLYAQVWITQPRVLHKVRISCEAGPKHGKKRAWTIFTQPLFLTLYLHVESNSNLLLNNLLLHSQIPGAQATPITVGTPAPTTSRICGRVFSATDGQTNAIAYSIAQESVCSQRVSCLSANATKMSY